MNKRLYKNLKYLNKSLYKSSDEKASASVTKTVPLTKEQEAIYKALDMLS
jgi:hypothetical protein